MKHPLIIFNPNSDPKRLNEVKKAISWLSVTLQFGIVGSYLDSLGFPQLHHHDGITVYESEEKAILDSDSILSLGGDGTVLYCVHALAGIPKEDRIFDNVPIIPINFGTVGFICPYTLDDLYNDEVYDYDISERYMLLCNGEETALNEIAIIKTDHGIRRFRIKHNQQDVSEFRADGVILSTATGSTAYSFSCGGPILFPGSGNDAISITPISPIDASLKPIIIPLGEGDRLHVRSDNTKSIVDGSPSKTTSEVVVEKHPQKLKLATPRDFNYFNLLKQKLGWSRLSF